MTISIAFYKGPPKGDPIHTLSHLGIRAWTWSRWSHAELLINGVCYSSSARDGGVRSKVIDLNSGRWDVVELDSRRVDELQALAWFIVHKDAKYDWLGIAGFILPIFGHEEDRFVCFESIGEALGLAGAHKLTANDLYAWATARQPTEPAWQQSA